MALFAFSSHPTRAPTPYLFHDVNRGDLGEMRDPTKRSRRQRESRKASSSQYCETHSSLWNASGGCAQTEEGGKMVAIWKHGWIRKGIAKGVRSGKVECPIFESFNLLDVSWTKEIYEYSIFGLCNIFRIKIFINIYKYLIFKSSYICLIYLAQKKFMNIQFFNHSIYFALKRSINIRSLNYTICLIYFEQKKIRNIRSLNDPIMYILHKRDLKYPIFESSNLFNIYHEQHEKFMNIRSSNHHICLIYLNKKGL